MHTHTHTRTPHCETKHTSHVSKEDYLKINLWNENIDTYAWTHMNHTNEHTWPRYMHTHTHTHTHHAQYCRTVDTSLPEGGFAETDIQRLVVDLEGIINRCAQYIHICICVCVYVCIHIYITCVYILYVYVCMYMCMYVCICIYTANISPLSIFYPKANLLNTHMYVSICLYVYMYIYTHIHTYT